MRLGDGVPALIAHPDWQNPAPFVLWMHGRTVNKELDPGRYLRWIRAGVAAVAIDLPFHGERADETKQGPADSLDVIERALSEIDPVVADATAIEGGSLLDAERIGLGGMSLGGMVALRRLCDAHTFKCAAVEATSGALERYIYPADHGDPVAREVEHPRERVRTLDALSHLDTWREIPLLALHSETDAMVPFSTQSAFIEALRERYADPSRIELVTWPETGAPSEHLGFGRFANDAKNAQTAFLARCLNASPPAAGA